MFRAFHRSFVRIIRSIPCSLCVITKITPKGSFLLLYYRKEFCSGKKEISGRQVEPDSRYSSLNCSQKKGQRKRRTCCLPPRLIDSGGQRLRVDHVLTMHSSGEAYPLIGLEKRSSNNFQKYTRALSSFYPLFQRSKHSGLRYFWRDGDKVV